MTRNTKKKTNKAKFNSRVTVHKIEPNNAAEFDQRINHMQGPVLFHLPGCIHCIEMRPKWLEVIKQLKNKNIDCQIMEVNAQALPLIHHPLGKVEGFPRLINVENGTEKDVFSDERNVENMLEFVLKHLKNKMNLPYDYNLNKKGHLVKLTDPNNIKRVRHTGYSRKTRNRKTRNRKNIRRQK